MPATHLLALDQGTSSSRAIVYDATGRIKGVAQRAFRQHFPQPGWVEHDAEEIWTSQLRTARAALRKAGVRARDLAGIGITNQRETVVLWERASGRPLAHAIVWQDRRTSYEVERLRATGAEKEISTRTGLLLDPYFSATKIAWLLDHVRGARARAQRGELAVGTIDCWLLWNLTAGRVHATDLSNASRTLLCDIRRGAWDGSLLETFRIPRAVLPEIIPSAGELALSERSLLGAAVPITGIAGDQQAALFGQRCIRPGMSKCTYGTGCFLLVHTGERVVRSRARLLSTVAWRIDRGPIEYALEGSVFVGGSAIQWLRDGLGIIKRASEVGPLALSVPDSGGVVVVPAFTGLGAPWWDSRARGTILGVTRGTTRAHLARATLEAIAFEVSDLHEAMVRDLRRADAELRVDGGASASDALMQFQADLLGVRVSRPEDLETTARGAALLAGVGAGLFRGDRAMESHRRVDRSFSPSIGREARKARLAVWRRAIERAKGWAPQESE
ncbi:MAG: glycerol kinase GlpK [Phycisphaeraceae bacterium]|nr:glycerol kinase GlpK [Phycisphaeraceae bacterium]